MEWLVLAFLVSYLVVQALRHEAGKQRSAEMAQATPGPVAHHWPGKSEFDVEVVGESFYADSIRAIANNSDGEHADYQGLALLVPNDLNPYDDKAVAVLIEGRQVGHLSRDEARQFRRRLSAKKLTGQTTSCDALIEWGGRGAGEKMLDYSIRLDMKPFD